MIIQDSSRYRTPPLFFHAPVYYADSRILVVQTLIGVGKPLLRVFKYVCSILNAMLKEGRINSLCNNRPQRMGGRVYGLRA